MTSGENALIGAKIAPRTKGRDKKTEGVLYRREKMDIVFFTLLMVLLTTGLVMLFSASYAYAYYMYNNSYHFIIKQSQFAIIGVVVALIVSRIDYHLYAVLYAPWILYVATVGLLVLVLFLPTYAGFDYKRWIVLGGINFQPSEIAKFSIILLFSYLISRNYRKMKTFKFGVLPYIMLLALVCGLVVVEPHLSATLLIFAIGIILMIVGGIRLRWLVIGGGVGIAGAAVAILSGVVDYGSDRIKYWIDPWASASDKGYQTIQSLLAIGSGGFWGRGLGQSRQKYLWVPEPHNDFIFSIVCEELGFIGAFCILVLFGLLVWRGVLIAMRAPDKFGCLLAIGITFQVGLQAVLNILVVTNTVPNTGISLPFFSYGGSSLLMLMAQMGILLSISRSSTVRKN